MRPEFAEPGDQEIAPGDCPDGAGPDRFPPARPRDCRTLRGCGGGRDGRCGSSMRNPAAAMQSHCNPNCSAWLPSSAEAPRCQRPGTVAIPLAVSPETAEAMVAGAKISFRRTEPVAGSTGRRSPLADSHREHRRIAHPYSELCRSPPLNQPAASRSAIRRGRCSASPSSDEPASRLCRPSYVSGGKKLAPAVKPVAD